MNVRRTSARRPGGTVTVIGWFVAGASVISSATAVAMSAVALHRIAGRIGEQARVPETRVDYVRERISGVGRAPHDAHVPVLRSVPPVPPENPHAPPTPPLGTPTVKPLT